MSQKITADDLVGVLGDRRLVEQLAFIVEVEKLKSVLRRTPLLDRSRVENDAEHTWELALMAVVLAEYSDEEIDVLRVLKMLLIHDIVEIDAGDTFAFDSQAAVDQPDRERRAADRIFGLLPSDQAREFRALWDEFEAKSTSEARFAAAMDRLQPSLHNFFTDGGTWRTPGVTSRDVDRRIAPIATASSRLGELAAKFVALGIEQGFIAAAPARAELFHRISESDSAASRRRASELGLVGAVEFRNVDFESDRAALVARGGGGATPALWDGARLHVGRDAVLAALEVLARGGSAPA